MTAPSPSLRRRERRERATLERLADWLLEESVAFRRLDAFRLELGLDVPAMARLMGVSPSTYGNWRAARAVPLGNRDEMHEVVSSYLRSLTDAQNGGNEAVLGGLARRLHGVTARLSFRVAVPSRTTPAEADWKHAPHLWLGLEGVPLRHEREQGREARLRELRELHGAGCECRLCAARSAPAPGSAASEPLDALSRPAAAVSVPLAAGLGGSCGA